MSGGLGMGGMGMGMGFTMPTMSPMSMAPTATAPTAMPTPTPIFPTASLAGPMTPTPQPYLSMSPQMAGSATPPTSSVPGLDMNAPIYNEGQAIPGPNSYGTQTLQENGPELNPFEINPRLEKGGIDRPPTNLKTPVIKPDMMKAAPIEVSAQSRVNPLAGVKQQSLQSTFEGLGGAGPSASVLDVKGPVGGQTNVDGPNSPTTSGFRAPQSQPMQGDFTLKAGESNIRIDNADVDRLAKIMTLEAGNIKGPDGAFDMNARKAVIDTVLNRAASGQYGDGIKGVIDAPKQFSPVNGRGSIDNIDRPVTPEMRAFVREHLSNRAQGGESTVGDSTHFLNPHASGQNALSTWARTWNEGKIYGQGTNIHSHFTPKGMSGAPKYSVTAGWNTPQGGSMANVPTNAYGRVDTASMQIQPTPLQQAVMATAPQQTITAAQGIQRAFTSVNVPTVQGSAVQTAVAPAAPQTTAASALETAFTTAMVEDGNGPANDVLQRQAQNNLTRLQNDPNATLINQTSIFDRTDLPMSGGGYDATLATDPTNYVQMFAAPRTSGSRTEGPMTAAGTSETQNPINNPALPQAVEAIQGNPQNAPVSPSGARTGVSRSAPVGRATPKSSGTEPPLSPVAEQYLDNANLLNIGPNGSSGRGMYKPSSNGGMEFSSSMRKVGPSDNITPEIEPSKGGGSPSSRIKGYRIMDRQTGKQVGGEYTNGVRAMQRVNKLDERHGSARYRREPIYE